MGDGCPSLLNANINEKVSKVLVISYSFVVINEEYLYQRRRWDGFIKIENLNIDVKTFSTLSAYYFKDSNFVYSKSRGGLLRILKNADPYTFDVFTYDNSVPYFYAQYVRTLAKDKNSIFFT